MRFRRAAAAVGASVLFGGLLSAAAPSAQAGPSVVSASTKTHPIYLPNMLNQWNVAGSNYAALQPPAPPCPASGLLPPPLTNCGVPEFPAVGQPYLGNMAYWGGHVQVTPKEYLVLFGWGKVGAFTSACTPETFPEVVAGQSVNVTLKCDPAGAGKRMADFVSQIGGTQWEGVTTQYYQTVDDPAGKAYNQYITNPSSVLAGVWSDDIDPINANITYTQMAQEAARAAAHFHVSDLANANFIIAQPQNFSDPLAASAGYCAFHDYTEPGLEGGIYDGIPAGISFTNMPYLAAGAMATNCGQGVVNAGAAGNLDAVTIALGHEILETVTDPAAEDILPGGQVIGAWFDPFDANENGDKCAYVGVSPTYVFGLGGIGGTPALIPDEPGELANITGNRGTEFAVQSTWSNNAAAGLGYCAGAGNDLPA